MKFKANSTWATWSVVLASLLVGCGKKEPAATAPAPETTAQAAPLEPQASSSTAQTAVAPDSRLAESQAALKARDYEKAAAALLALQTEKIQLNERQTAAAVAQMRQLQASLADAVASGDPRAKAAADRLRQSAMAH